MMRSWVAALFLLLGMNRVYATSKRDQELYDYYVVHLQPGVDPRTVSDYLQLDYGGFFGELENHYVFRAADKSDSDRIATEIHDLKQRRIKQKAAADSPHILDHVLLSIKQRSRKRGALVKRTPLAAKGRRDVTYTGTGQAIDWAVQEGLETARLLAISDPHFNEQWHLHNTIEISHDINVTGVWKQGITGKNSTVCIVDDGIDIYNTDLRSNYFADGSWDFNDPGPDPQPRLPSESHGTRCAGELGAARNNVCGIGVAYDSKISGCRILSSAISEADEARALNYKFQQNKIYLCSWGPPDDGRAMEEPGILVRRALVNGVQNGRGGLGSIYVFATGNGGDEDNCNFDGYANSIYTVTVGSIDRKDKQAFYSERCSAQLVVSYSSGGSPGDAIYTSDVGVDGCYANHGGTTAASSLVSGIYALMLEANSDLTWRDIQWLTVVTAVKLEEQQGDYQRNEAIGKDFSHRFGYGKADAYALVEAAKTWKSVRPQAWYHSPPFGAKLEIPEGDQALASSFEVTKQALEAANLDRLEHVTVTVSIMHTHRGDLSVELHSPAGMVSYLATPRVHDSSGSGYVGWTFMSVAHWGEAGVGKWTLVVKDTESNLHTGFLTHWHLVLWGECSDGRKQSLLPLPIEHYSDVGDSDSPGLADSWTTTVQLPSGTSKLEGDASNYPTRPTKPSARPDATALQIQDDSKIEETIQASSRPAGSSSFLSHVAIAILSLSIILSVLMYCIRRRRRQAYRRGYGRLQTDENRDDRRNPLVRRGSSFSGRSETQRETELSGPFAIGTDDDSENNVANEEDESKGSDNGRRNRVGAGKI